MKTTHLIDIINDLSFIRCKLNFLMDAIGATNLIAEKRSEDRIS